MDAKVTTNKYDRFEPKLYSGTVEFSEEIHIGTLESLENFLLDDVAIYSKEGEELYSWDYMEDLRQEAPNATKYTVQFTYGNGTFWTQVENNKFRKISFEMEYETFKDRESFAADVETLINDTKERVEIVSKAKEGISADEGNPDIDIF